MSFIDWTHTICRLWLPHIPFRCEFNNTKYGCHNPPPTGVKPLPVEHIKLVVQACHTSNTAKDACTANMISIAFFFLCHLGEHMVTFDNKPFKLSNVQFYKDDKPYLYSLPSCCT